MNQVVRTFVIILILGIGIVCNAYISFAYVSPGAPKGFVNDYAMLLAGEERNSIEQLLKDIEKSSLVEFVVVIIPQLGDETIETYAIKLFEEWGIGKKGADNGILLLISHEDRKLRIEVGYGLEGIITDAFSARLIQTVLAPAFAQGKYADGIIEVVMRISTVVVDPSGVAAQLMNDELKAKSVYSESFFSTEAGKKVYALASFLVWFLLKRTRSWWLGGVLGALASIIYVSVGLSGSSILVKIVVVIACTALGFLLDFVASRSQSSRIGGGFGGFGGGSSGGFGGFGGGRSGGGGSSGGW